MPRIYGFMGRNDPGRISTISSSPLDYDKESQLKRKLVLQATKDSKKLLYVEDCSSHTQGVDALVPVVLMTYSFPVADWVELGVARCCPLCWLIVVPPVGVELPEPQLLLPVLQKKEGSTKRQRVAATQARIERFDRCSEVKAALGKYGPLTLQGLMDVTDYRREELRWALEKLTNHGGPVEVLRVGRKGRGHAALYGLKTSLKKSFDSPTFDQTNGVVVADEEPPRAS